MNAKRLFIGAIVIAAAFGLSYFENHFRSHELQSRSAQGATAPDFSLPNLAGGQLQLSSYRGKIILLDFWATWCEPCRDEIPRLEELQNKYGNHGLQIIGISMDDESEPVRDFYQHFHMNYPVAMGNANIGTLYGGVLGLPIALVIGRDGRIHSKHIGATDVSVFENEIVALLQQQSGS